MTRQEANRKILSILKAKYYNFFKDYFDTIEEWIEKFPDGRFGQIICNWICPDYRDANPSWETLIMMVTLFPDDPDPFFEESVTTLERLTTKNDEELTEASMS